MLGSFAEIDLLLGKQPVNDPRSFEHWYLELLLERLNQISKEDYSKDTRNYLRYQIIQNFNQNFLGWKSYKEHDNSPLDFLLIRDDETPIKSYNPRHPTEMMFFMVRYPEIMSTFGITYNELKNLPIGEINRLKSVLDMMRRSNEEGDG